MKMNPEEITAIIKDQIKNYNVDLNVDDVGTVIEIGDGIAHIHGLTKAMAGELLDFGNDIYGLALNLDQDDVGAVILGGDTEIKEGATVKRTKKIMQVPVGENMVGRVVDDRRQGSHSGGRASRCRVPRAGHRGQKVRP